MIIIIMIIIILIIMMIMIMIIIILIIIILIKAEPLGDLNFQRACCIEHKAVVLGFEVLNLKSCELKL